MTDTDRLYKLLQREGPRGVHTHDLRKEGYSGNPSQRATDVETKFGVTVKRVTEFRNGRNGSRFQLIGLTAEKRSTRPSRLCRESDESIRVDTDDTSLKGQTEAGVGVDPGGAIPLFEEHRPPTAYDPFSQAA